MSAQQSTSTDVRPARVGVGVTGSLVLGLVLLAQSGAAMRTIAPAVREHAVSITRSAFDVRGMVPAQFADWDAGRS